MRTAKSLIILAFCAANFALTVDAGPVLSKTQIENFLTDFGYLGPRDPKNESPVPAKELSEAISKYQSFMKTEVTGKIDSRTTNLMKLPRCGVKDKINAKSTNRSAAYETFGSKWGRTSLTYRITRYPKVLSKAHVDQEIARAFSVWSDYTDLTFTPRNGQVDIVIMFASGYHGDGIPFDGPAKYGQTNTLAHAYEPGEGIGGDTHFDDDEIWTVNEHRGTNLFQVAAHEFGHALGLDHSTVREALMAPIYRGFQPNFRLHTDDISGIQQIYGRKYGKPESDDRNTVWTRREYPGWPNWFTHFRFL